VCDLLVLDPCVVTEFHEGEVFVTFFFQCSFNFMHQPGALAITFSGYQLYVFWVDAYSFDIFYHTACFFYTFLSCYYDASYVYFLGLLQTKYDKWSKIGHLVGLIFGLY
jgi:hypothetical protein